MQRFKTHQIGIVQGDEVLFSDFQDDGAMWSGKGPRQSRAAIRFPESFAAAPQVMVSLSMIDMSRDTNMRMDVQAENIGPAGFEIVFRTWGDSKVARARVAWQAIGPVSADDQWDV